jgi:septum formation protein
MIILASQSQIRSQLLKATGIDFSAMPSPINEQHKHRELSALTAKPLAIALAKAKAQPLATKYPKALVIGVDQCLECQGEIFHKVTTTAAARSQLQSLRGKPHALHTAYSIMSDQIEQTAYCDTAVLTMRHFSDDFLDSYLATNAEILKSSVGCYQLEASGIQLMETIAGDYFTILGLPLLPLLSDLRKLGAIPS